MAVKLFILGRPGSGKTTAARYISSVAKGKHLVTRHVNDFKFLRKMFKKDTKHEKFQPREHGGFDVTDFSVLVQALRRVEKKVRRHASSVDLITIEFARGDYSVELGWFKPDFLQDSYFLYIDTDIDICIQRISERIINQATIDDNFISDEILRSYYSKDNRPYMISHCKKEHGIDKIVEIIDNNGSPEEFAEKVRLLADSVFKQEFPTARSFTSYTPDV